MTSEQQQVLLDIETFLQDHVSMEFFPDAPPQPNNVMLLLARMRDAFGMPPPFDRHHNWSPKD